MSTNDKIDWDLKNLTPEKWKEILRRRQERDREIGAGWGLDPLMSLEEMGIKFHYANSEGEQAEEPEENAAEIPEDVPED